MIRSLLITSALGFMAPVKKETEPVKASAPAAADLQKLVEQYKAEAATLRGQYEIVAKERDDARGEAAKLAEENTKLVKENALEIITKERDDARGEAAKLAEENAVLQTRTAKLSALRSPPSAPPPPPPSKSSALPPGITEEMVTAKIRESENQLPRADAVRLLVKHAAKAAQAAEAASAS